MTVKKELEAEFEALLITMFSSSLSVNKNVLKTFWMMEVRSKVSLK